MCFSAEASFTAGSVLAVIGAFCLKKTAKGPLKWVAMIPIIFAAQQWAEGVVWLCMNGIQSTAVICTGAQSVFLSIAWVVWPLYIPIAYLTAEPVPWKRRVCYGCLLLGFLIAITDIHYLIVTSIAPKVHEGNIHYPEARLYGDILYGVVTMIPIFLSSIAGMWLFGLFLLLSFIASQLIWTFTFTSVWCFFSAISSLLLLKILNK